TLSTSPRSTVATPASPDRSTSPTPGVVAVALEAPTHTLPGIRRQPNTSQASACPRVSAEPALLTSSQKIAHGPLDQRRETSQPVRPNHRMVAEPANWLACRSGTRR